MENNESPIVLEGFWHDYIVGRIRHSCIEGCFHIWSNKFFDDRGYFTEVFNETKFKKETGIDFKVVQVNKSVSQKNVIRGLHFQKGEHAQAKLVSCTNGKILDFAVDIRKDSPTFGMWVGAELSAKEGNQLFIPRGCAHGFRALTDDATIQYLVDNEYNKESEGGIIYNDRDINIPWFNIDETHAPIVSDKDMAFPTLKELEI